VGTKAYKQADRTLGTRGAQHIGGFAARLGVTALDHPVAELAGSHDVADSPWLWMAVEPKAVKLQRYVILETPAAVVVSW